MDQHFGEARQTYPAESVGKNLPGARYYLRGDLFNSVRVLPHVMPDTL